MRKKPLHERWAGFLPDDVPAGMQGRVLAHTDMSPHNMLVTLGGELLLLDLALACPAPAWADTALTRSRDWFPPTARQTGIPSPSSRAPSSPHGRSGSTRGHFLTGLPSPTRPGNGQRGVSPPQPSALAELPSNRPETPEEPMSSAAPPAPRPRSGWS
ncbi:phosphotransferase [Streptomyces canus]|uniref:phosphotransferase n=1 Tax=Streptomyces canus TaxID=58343 RepID=UPI00338D6633